MHATKEILFENAFLSTDTVSGFVERVNSHAVVPTSETIMLQAIVHNMDTAELVQLDLKLEGSYDGQVWLTTGLSTADITISDTSPQSKSSTSKLAVDYAFIRLRATASTLDSAGSVLFSANVVFTHQAN